jgi:hypothetical protein
MTTKELQDIITPTKLNSANSLKMKVLGYLKLS